MLHLEVEAILPVVSLRIVEEELIAIEILDHQKPVAPRAILDRYTPGLVFCSRGDLGLRLGIQGNEQ